MTLGKLLKMKLKLKLSREARRKFLNFRWSQMGVLQKPIADLNNLSANVLKLAVTMRAANTFEQIARFFRPEIFSAENV